MLVEARAIGELAGRLDGRLIDHVGAEVEGEQLADFGLGSAVVPSVLLGVHDLEDVHEGFHLRVFGNEDPALLIDAASSVAHDAPPIRQGCRCRGRWGGTEPTR